MRWPETLTKLSDFGDLFQPQEAVEPILSKPVRGALSEWLVEIFAQDKLEAVGLKPRKKAMFFGPPGSGKTTLSHHLSARVGLNMLAVRPDRIIDCWVGSTGRNIGALFDACANLEEPIVLLIDEFDAIAPSRQGLGGGQQHRAEAVNTLLQRIDQYDGFVIAATNFAERIDQAIWRRFDVHITIDLPGQFERERILERYLAPYGLPEHALNVLAESLEIAAPSLMRQLCEAIKRQLVLGPELGWDMRCEAVFARLLAAIQPHPDIGKPRLWSLGHADRAIRELPWPLPLAKDVTKAKRKTKKAENPADNVVTLNTRGAA